MPKRPAENTSPISPPQESRRPAFAGGAGRVPEYHQDQEKVRTEPSRPKSRGEGALEEDRSEEKEEKQTAFPKDPGLGGGGQDDRPSYGHAHGRDLSITSTCSNRSKSAAGSTSAYW